MKDAMSDSELESLYLHGYVVMRGIIPKQLCLAAKRIVDDEDIEVSRQLLNCHDIRSIVLS